MTIKVGKDTTINIINTDGSFSPFTDNSVEFSTKKIFDTLMTHGEPLRIVMKKQEYDNCKECLHENFANIGYTHEERFRSLSDLLVSFISEVDGKVVLEITVPNVISMKDLAELESAKEDFKDILKDL